VHPFLYLQQRNDIKECCKNMLNLRVAKTGPSVLKAACMRCGGEHIKLRIDPFHIHALR
jgi:hypothetical protein